MLTNEGWKKGLDRGSFMRGRASVRDEASGEEVLSAVCIVKWRDKAGSEHAVSQPFLGFSIQTTFVH